MSHATVVSSPGKVLAAGGYLVLDPAYSGVVISTSSRFYAVVQDLRRVDEIQVRSPQFTDAVWNYQVLLNGVNVRVEPKNGKNGAIAPKNKFVQLALLHTLSYCFEVKGLVPFVDSLAEGLDVVIAGDNDFYSQRAKLASMNLPRTISSLSKIPPFGSQGVALSDVHKTGLGSSAALITSLVTSLLLHFSVISPADLTDTPSDARTLVHNLAQFVHCLAQGKVGSGFDVSAAVFGSQIYTRFDPARLQPLMERDAFSTRPLKAFLSSADQALDHRVEPFKLPPLTRMMLADVDAGSDTPSLVGKVLKWRKAQSAQADALWTALNQSNQALAKALLNLSDLYAGHQTAYEDVVNQLASLAHDQWVASAQGSTEGRQVAQKFFEAHQISEDIRAKMREMGDLSEVPIEPSEQTALLDACVSQPGVIGGGVPGAGGYDAIWLLVFEPGVEGTSPLQRVEKVWSTYTALDVSPLSSEESVAKGARVERLEEIPGLRDFI
ncbi:Phosphomevalonate kinase [Athelia psychrophila]|uniref:Phosphomevalonate kinase n=1 Tax=Athelia psychrophila TaxID=1759441 RepID=A0A166XEB6_9AGAM|nr:Phosphomevalonate kinase [Fibularhizoctonia sp. CBS 109695]